MKRLIILFALAAISASEAQSQENLELIDGGCVYDGTTPPTEAVAFASDSEARDWVSKICRQVGLEPNFQIMAADVPNAMATMSKDGQGKRLILYNQIFMEKMDSSIQDGGRWPSVSILAHEIGHHLQNHILERSSDSHKNELQADKFSGFVLAKLGATLAQATSAMEQLPTEASATHPARKTRLAAIANGWKEANTLAKEISEATKEPVPTEPQAQEKLPDPIPAQNPPTSSQPPTAQLIGRVIFNGNPIQHFLSSDGTIVSLDPFTNQLVIYGWQRAPRLPSFAWSIHTPQMTYDVDFSGRIVVPNAFGQPVYMGYVTR